MYFLNGLVWYYGSARVIQTMHGKFKVSLFKWGFTASPECDCGAPLQIMKHIIYECDRLAYLGDSNHLTAARPQAIQYTLNLECTCKQLQGLKK